MTTNKQISGGTFNVLNSIFMAGILLIVAYPLYFVLIASISEPNAVNLGEVYLFPKGFSLLAYQRVLDTQEVWIGYKNTLIITVVGTFYNVALTFSCAYALSRKEMVGRNVITFIFAFTMYFNGGLIPNYLLVRELGLYNSLWALIIPTGCRVFLLIVARTYLMANIHQELYDSSNIDGCSDARAFFSIVIPLAKPILAVISLFYAISHWNQFFLALIYIENDKLYPLQFVLRNIILESQMQEQVVDLEQIEAASRKVSIVESMKYALIIIASLPILAAYPFAQKYFVKGLTVGSIKG